MSKQIVTIVGKTVKYDLSVMTEKELISLSQLLLETALESHYKPDLVQIYSNLAEITKVLFKTAVTNNDWIRRKL